MRDILTYICMFLALISVASCSEKELEDTSADNESAVVETGNLVDVPCELIVQPFGGNTTKAAALPEDYTSEEQDLDNFWLLQFDADGKFLAAVYHIPIADAEGNKWGNSYVRMSEAYLAVTKTVWIVANIGETDTNGTRFFSNYAGKTLTDFYNDGLPLSDLNQLRAINGGSSCVSDPAAGLSIPLSGSAPFDVNDLSGVDDKKGLVVRLKSIVAKLTVDASAVANVYQIKLMRIPSMIRFTPEQESTTTAIRLLYDYVIADDVYLNSRKTVTLYIPQNKPKNSTTANSEGSAIAKTKNAPSRATYVSLDVENGNKYVAINIFPGTDASDYTISANTHYKETVKVESAIYGQYLDDTKNDSRLIEKRINEITSNCYIINPLKNGLSAGVYSSNYREEVYALPVVHRVNEAWILNNSNKCIGENDEWIIHHLWQDEPTRLIYFTESSGLKAWSLDGERYATEYYGKGKEALGYVYVAAERDANITDNRGNVLIALRKKDKNGSYIASNGERYGEIIWSWHLWITDYEPDAAGTWSSGYYRTVRGTSGSKVFHYKYWDSNSYDWIMDRHLGSKGWEPATLANTSKNLKGQTTIRPDADGYGLFYQWGRKDPFPGRYISHNTNINEAPKLYDITGKSISKKLDLIDDNVENIGTQHGIWNTHSKPTTLVSYPAASDNNWKRPSSWPQTKSLFDPCPPGWEVSSQQVFYGNGKGLVNALGGQGTASGGKFSNMNYNYLFQYGGNSGNYEGYAVDVTGNKGANNEHVTYFPASGFVTAAGSRDLGGICDLWMCEQKTQDYASFMYIGYPLKGSENVYRSSNQLTPVAYVRGGDSAFSKALAFGVRCVKP